MKRSSLRLKATGLLLAGLLVAVLLAACGDNTATSATSNTTAAATSAAAAPTAAASAATTAAATSAAAVTTAAGATSAAATTAAGTASAAASPIGVPLPTGAAPATVKTGAGVDAAAKTIKVGFLAPLTGNFASQGLPYQLGQKIFFQSLNDNGGIYGYKIVMDSQDSQYSPQVAVQAYNKMVDNIAMFSCIFGTPVMAALKDQSAQSKILVLHAGNSSAFLGSTNIIVSGEPYVADVLNGFDYVVNKLGKKSVKSAIIYQDDALGADALVGYKAAVKTFGLTDVGQISYRIQDTDFTGQATTLKNSGAEYIYVAGVGAKVGPMVTQAAALGFNGKYFLQVSAWDPSILKTNAKDPLTGSMVLLTNPNWSETQYPGMAALVAAVNKYAPGQQESSVVTSGWMQGIETYLILKKAIESGDLTPTGILAASQTLKNADLGGVAPPLTVGTTANERVPSRASYIGEINPSLPSLVKPLENAYISDAAKNYAFQ